MFYRALPLLRNAFFIGIVSVMAFLYIFESSHDDFQSYTLKSHNKVSDIYSMTEPFSSVSFFKNS